MKKICFYIQLFLLLELIACGNKPTNNSIQQNVAQDVVANTQQPTKKTILFFGNSLTAGYGLAPNQSFPALIQQTIDQLHLPWQVVNAGVSGETTAGGLARIDWILRQQPHIFVLELGGNDGLRGIALSDTKKNLQAIITKVKSKYPNTVIILAGMQIPPNLGQEYTEKFKDLYPQLATKNHIVLIPFLLEGVGGNPALNQNDGIHPNAEGAKIVAANVWHVLKNYCK
jgi:acyl-CoA thioesterase-1